MTELVKQIGSIELSYPLWVEEYFSPNDTVGEVVMSSAGSHIVYEAEIFTPYITLVSKRQGWLTKANMIALKSSYLQLDTTFLLTYDDDTTDTVRFAREFGESGFSFSPITEGSERYTAIIKTAKVL